MNLLVMATTEFPEGFPWDQFTRMYVVDRGDLENFPAEDANRLPTFVVTAHPDGIPETLLNQIEDVIEDEDPVQFVISRGIPGDVAALGWDDSDESYEILRDLNRSGVTVLDPLDSWIEVVIDKELSFEDLVETITQRVTTDVLRIVRAELSGDTPRRGRFRSPAPRA